MSKHWTDTTWIGNWISFWANRLCYPKDSPIWKSKEMQEKFKTKITWLMEHK